MVEEMCARKVEAYVEASLRNLSEIGRKVTLHDNRSSIDAGKRNVTRERSFSELENHPKIQRNDSKG